MAQLKSTIIGCGAIAREHIKALSLLTNVEVAAVCDLSAVRAEATAKQFGIKNWFSDYEEMLSSIRSDMVHITTPPASHFPIAKRCLEAKLNVLCEKPITIDYSQFAQLKELATRNNCILLENQNYRFHSSVQRILKLCESGQLGTVLDVQICVALDLVSPGNPYADPNMPHFAMVLRGGVIGDLLPHIAYLTQLLTGPTIDVHTIWQKRQYASPLPADEFRGVVRGERATAYTSFSGNAQPNGFWIKVTGTRMCVEANLFETPRLSLKRLRPGERALMTLVDGIAESRDIFQSSIAGFWRKLGGVTSYDGLPELISRTYQSLRDKDVPPISLEAIDASAQLVNGFTSEDNYL